MRRTTCLPLAFLLIAAPVLAQAPAAPRQTQADDYTSYELLAPETQQFRILYDVAATTAGATVFLNPIRQGSTASDERVTDLATGRPLTFAVIAGSDARRLGLPNAQPDAQYLRIDLARPVPPDGEQRIRIDKTYKDPVSYSRDGADILFTRLLGIRRNKVVLPPGYELVSCNTPVQVFTEDDGRVAVSFVNVQPGQVGLELRATRLPASAARPRPGRRPPRLPAAPLRRAVPRHVCHRSRNRRRSACPIARSRTGRSPTGCSRRARTPSTSRTTTPKAASAPIAT